jgi:hypothetical protein
MKKRPLNRHLNLHSENDNCIFSLKSIARQRILKASLESSTDIPSSSSENNNNKDPSSSNTMSIKKTVQKIKSSKSFNCSASGLMEEPFIVHPGAVITLFHLITNITSNTNDNTKDNYFSYRLQYNLVNLLRNLFRIERNQQIMSKASFIDDILKTCQHVLGDEDHYLNGPIQNLFERLATQSISPKNLRQYLRLGTIFEEWRSTKPTTLQIFNDSNEKNNKILIPLNRVKCLISMTTPRNQSSISKYSSTSFIEFNMLVEGFGCLFLPSIAPQLATAPSIVAMGMVSVGNDTTVNGGVGSGERLFPPQSGISYSTWIYIDKLGDSSSSGVKSIQPIRLLTFLKHSKMKDTLHSCFSAYISPKTRSLIISTEETLLSQQRYDLKQDSNVYENARINDSTVRFNCGDHFQEGKWIHIVIVLSRAVLKNSSATLYINSHLISSQKLHYINPSLVAGTSPSSISIHAVIGTLPLFRLQSPVVWRQASCYLIEDILSAQAITTVFALGPNYLGSFQSPHLDSLIQHNESQSQSGSLAQSSSSSSSTVQSGVASTTSLTALVSEEKVIFGLHSSNEFEITMVKFRKIYNKNDSRTIGKQLNLPSNESLTPLRILANTAGQLNGPARSFGGLVIGYMGVRTFQPIPVARSIENIGGNSFLLGLIAIANDIEFMYAAVKALVYIVKSNVEINREMDRNNAYQVLGMLFKRKKHLINSHILNLTFSLAVTDDYSTTNSANNSDAAGIGNQKNDQVSSMGIISNMKAFEYLLCDLEIWYETTSDIQRSLHERFNELLENPINVRSFTRIGMLKRLLFMIKEPTSYSLNDTTLRYILSTIRLLVIDSSQNDELLKFGQYLASLLPAVNFNENLIQLESSTCTETTSSPPILIDKTAIDNDTSQNDLSKIKNRGSTLSSSKVFNTIYAIRLRNRLLKIIEEIVCLNDSKLMSPVSSPIVPNAKGIDRTKCIMFQEEIQRLLGHDWFLLFVQPNVHRSTVVLVTKILFTLLINIQNLNRFKETTYCGGWLQNVFAQLVSNNSRNTPLQQQQSASSSYPPQLTPQSSSSNFFSFDKNSTGSSSCSAQTATSSNRTNTATNDINQTLTPNNSTASLTSSPLLSSLSSSTSNLTSGAFHAAENLISSTAASSFSALTALHNHSFSMSSSSATVPSTPVMSTATTTAMTPMPHQNSASSTTSTLASDLSLDACSTPGFQILQIYLSKHADITELYYLLFALLLDAQTIKELPKRDETSFNTSSNDDSSLGNNQIEFDLNSICNYVFDKSFDSDQKLFCKINTLLSLEVSVILLSMSRTLMVNNNNIVGHQENILNENNDHAITLLQILRFMYHNCEEFHTMASNTSFLTFLVATLYPYDELTPQDLASPMTNEIKPFAEAICEKNDDTFQYKSYLSIHPARKLVMDFLRDLLYDGIVNSTVGPYTKTPPMIDLILFSLPEGANVRRNQEFITEVFKTIIDYLLASDIFNEQIGSTNIFSTSSSSSISSILQRFSELIDRLADKLWDGSYRRDAKEVFDTISRFIQNLKKKAYNFNNEQLVNSLNRVLLYQLSRPYDSEALNEQVYILDALHKITAFKSLIFGNNVQSEFYGCVTFCLLKITSDKVEEYNSDSRKQSTTDDTHISKSHWYLSKNNRSIDADNLEGEEAASSTGENNSSTNARHLLVSAAQRIWLDLYMEKKSVLEDCLKVSLNSIDKSPTLDQLRPVLWEPAVKCWQSFIEGEKKLPEKIQSQLHARFQRVTGGISTMAGGLSRVVSLKKPKKEATKLGQNDLYEASAQIERNLTAFKEYAESDFRRHFRGNEQRHSYLHREWLKMEKDLLRERSIWGEKHENHLNKWKLDFTEGPNRKRKRILPNNDDFYSHYPYRVELDTFRANRKHKMPWSSDSKEFFKQYRIGSLLYLDEYQREAIEIGKIIEKHEAEQSIIEKSMLEIERQKNEEKIQILNSTKDSEENKQMNEVENELKNNENIQIDSQVKMEKSSIDLNKTENEENLKSQVSSDASEKVEQSTSDSSRRDSGSSVSQTEANNKPVVTTATSSATGSPLLRPQKSTTNSNNQKLSSVMIPSTNFKTIHTASTNISTSTNNQNIVRLLEEGERINHIFRCARVQGLDTTEGVFMFGKEHFYVLDGFTIITAKDIVDIDCLKPNSFEPLIPKSGTTLGCTSPNIKSPSISFLPNSNIPTNLSNFLTSLLIQIQI